MRLSPRWQAYLSEHGIQKMFECILGALMMEQPEDPVTYIEQRLNEIQHIGVANINWDTFIFHMHPKRDAIRRELIHDGSVFDEEWAEERRLINELPDAGISAMSEVFELTESMAAQ